MARFWRTYQQVSLTNVVYGQTRKNSPKTRPKEGKNLPSELDNFRTIDFGEILTWYVRSNRVSTIVIRGLISKCKNFFPNRVLMRDGWVPKMVPRWPPDPVPNFFLTFFLLHGFRCWIVTSWYLMCSDSRQSISRWSYKPCKVALWTLFWLLFFD
jgi:hypothetical protein